MRRRLSQTERLAAANIVAAVAAGFDQRLEQSWQAACDYHSDGHKPSTAGTEGGRSAEHPDPTGMAAVMPPDPADQYRAELTAATRNLINAVTRWQNIVTLILSRADPKPARASRVPQCVNRWCGDDIVLPDGQVPARGRCGPCLAYLEAHDRDAPKSVIDGRRRVRRHREHV